MSTDIFTNPFVSAENLSRLGTTTDLSGNISNVFYDPSTKKFYKSPLTNPSLKVEVTNSIEAANFNQQFATIRNFTDRNYQQQLRTQNPNSNIPPALRQTIEAGGSDFQIPERQGGQGENPPFSIQELNRSTISGKSRKSYGDDLRYPIKMNQGVEAGNKQDVIKFTLYEYVPPNESGAGVGSQFGTSVNSKTRITKSKPKGSAILPIQPTISDSNAVNWQSDSINPLELAAFNLSTGAIEGGITGFENALNTVIGAIGNENEQNIRNAVTAAFASAAIGKNVFTRATGAILNPNVELLFNGPSLRVFNYSFKLSARSKPESERIQQIIRFFKQGMSVQRTKSNLFLSSPDVFGISYLLRESDNNPYMNRIKICALTNCSVDYTPTGSYMTFEDGSMVSYTLNLTFEELEPIYNDDYDELNAIGY